MVWCMMWIERGGGVGKGEVERGGCDASVDMPPCWQFLSEILFESIVSVSPQPTLKNKTSKTLSATRKVGDVETGIRGLSLRHTPDMHTIFCFFDGTVFLCETLDPGFGFTDSFLCPVQSLTVLWLVCDAPPIRFLFSFSRYRFEKNRTF